MRKVNGVIIALLFVLFATPAMAGIDQSHHDLPFYNTGVTVKDKCFFCHGLKDANSGAGLEANYGKVGAFCAARCHSGANLMVGSGNGIIPQAPAAVTSDTPVRPTADVSAVAMANSHGDNVAKVVAGVTVASSVASSGLPYVTSAKIECTSCHSVHDSANTPFLWAPMQGAAVQTGLCDKCHLSRANNNMVAGASPQGNHPVDFAVNPGAALTRTGGVGVATVPPRHGRTIHFDWSSGTLGAGVFDVTTPNGAALNTAAGAQYRTGGHLGDFSQQTGTTSQMGCYTCHSAHQPGGNGGSNNLTVVALIDGVGDSFSPICMGCHGAATTWAANATDNSVGGNGPSYYGHPYGSNSGYTSVAGGVGTYPVSVGGFTFTVPVDTVENANTQRGINFGPGGQVKCTTCHDVHLGVADSKALAQLGQAAGAAICNACHNGSELADQTDAGEGGGTPEGANAHHRTTTAAIGASYDPANDANNLAINTAWLTGAPATYYNMGVLTDGLQCADCHMFNGTAHNW
jgi:predicted CXXCH cytochrome family protein